MEHSTMLLTDFVKKLRILDKDLRASLSAEIHVERVCRGERDDALEAAELEGYTQALAQAGCIGEELESLWDALGARTEEQKKQDSADLERLTKCQLLLNTARNVCKGVLRAGELAGEKQTASVKLEELLNGKTDLMKLAGEVNTAFRQGNLKEAKSAYARLAASVQEAQRLLTGEISAIRTRLAKNGSQAEADWKRSGEQCTQTGKRALEETAGTMDQFLEQQIRTRREAEDRYRQEMEKVAEKKEERNDRIRSNFLDLFPPMELAEQFRTVCDAEPDLNEFHCAMALPEKVCLGAAEFELEPMKLSRFTKEFLSKYYPFLCRGDRVSLPCSLEPAGEGNYEFQYIAKQRPQAVKQAAGLAMRLFTLIPPGQIQITFADPVTLGESFAMFPRLVDLNAGTSNAINGRIWASPADIDRRLGELTEHISDITQRCLQDRYENLLEYNRMTESVQEGYRVLILMDYPAGMTEESLKKLEQIVRFGPKCGVFTILYRSEDQMKKLPDKLRPAVSAIRAGFQRLSFTDGGEIRFEGQVGGKNIVWKDKPTPARERLDDVIQTLKYGM